MNGRHKFSGELVWRQKSWAHSFVPKRCKNSCCGNVCTRLCVCVRAPVWLRGRDREGSVCGVCESVCVFSFKRRKTTVVTERSRKISYQIAEPILVPRGLKRAAASTINVSSRQYTVQKTKLSPLKTKPSPHLHVQLAGFFIIDTASEEVCVLLVSELTLATSHKQKHEATFSSDKGTRCVWPPAAAGHFKPNYWKSSEPGKAARQHDPHTQPEPNPNRWPGSHPRCGTAVELKKDPQTFAILP